MMRTILIAGAAVAALSLGACNKPADEAETGIVADSTTDPYASAPPVDNTPPPMPDGAAAGGSNGAGGAGDATRPAGAPMSADTPVSATGAPPVDTTMGPATATTPTGKVPLETDRKNNPPSNAPQ